MNLVQPRQSRSIVGLLSSVLCSATAVALLTTVLGKQVFDMTGSSLALGLLGLAEFAPAALLVFVTGTLADRFDRRLLTSIGLGLQAVIIAGLAWYAGTNPTSTVPIFLLVIAFGTAGAFATPATRALPADIMMPERLPWLVARQTAVWQGASIVGPVVGGVLYVVNVRAPYVAGTVFLVAAAVAAMFVSPSRHIATVPRPRGMREAVEGVRFVRSQPILLGAISLDLFAVLFGGAVALLPAIAEDRLGVGAVGLGLLRAAIGIGAGCVTLFLAVRPVRRRVGRTLLVAVALFGLGTIVLGATTNFVVAFIALVALSGADSVSVFIRSTLVPLVTPRDKRGRVLAVEGVFIGASNELGAFESGVVGQLLGPAVAIVLGGAACLGVAALWWVLFAPLRNVDRFPVGVDDPAAEVVPQSASGEHRRDIV
jgi:MFS family permease